jgi:hypothetical protein
MISNPNGFSVLLPSLLHARQVNVESENALPAPSRDPKMSFPPKGPRFGSDLEIQRLSSRKRPSQGATNMSTLAFTGRIQAVDLGAE